MSGEVSDLFGVQMSAKPTIVIEDVDPVISEQTVPKTEVTIKSNPETEIEKQLRQVSDPFKESTPTASTTSSKSQIPQQQSKQQVQSKSSSSNSISKITIGLIVLVIILIVTVIILLIIKPFKAKHDYQTMKENYDIAMEQAKDYQLKIQQLESDLSESTKANYESQQQLNAMKAMYNKKMAEDQFLIADGKNFNKKSPSYAEQRKQQYNKVANPNSEENKEGAKGDSNKTLAIPKFKDVGEPEIEHQQFDVPVAQQQEQQAQVVQQQIPVQQSQMDDIDITDVF